MEIQNETILDYKQVFNVAMKNMQKIRYVAFLLYSISALICCFVFAEHIESILRFFSFLLVIILTIQISIKGTFKKHMGGQPANFKYTFRDDEIETDLISLMVKKESRSTIRYQMINKIEFYQNYFYVYWASHKLLIVDRDGFPTEVDKNLVESFLKQKVKKIKEKSNYL